MFLRRKKKIFTTEILYILDIISALPHIELILAVGLKLSTKSDIKLPKSYR